MLSDRNYYRDPTSDSGHKTSHVSYLMLIIFANIAVYILEMATPTQILVNTPLGQRIQDSDKMTDLFGLVSTIVEKGEFYRIFTYMFIHGSFAHILFNMWGLYLFGSALESRIGPKSFLALYCLSGILGSLFWLSFNWGSNVTCIGASGAVFGVIIATAMFFPDMPIVLLFPPIPMKLKTFAIVYIVAEIFFETSKLGGNVAHIVHLGGGLGGYLFVLLFYKGQTLGFFSLFRPSKDKLDKNLGAAGWEIKTETVSQRELDRLLDKISRDGINSLSEEELDTLRKAREEMRRH